MYRYSRNSSPFAGLLHVVEPPWPFFFFFRSDVLVDSAELDEVMVWSPELLLPTPLSEVYETRTTRGRENFSRKCSANRGSPVESLLSLEPLLSPVEQSPPPEDSEFSL
uniref:(northern house mosquito) hypothetical protein n=1 Tax=Culex pipiens TaxID=7175 RepID=A0A8D7ZYD2_CULPI